MKADTDSFVLIDESAGVLPADAVTIDTDAIVAEEDMPLTPESLPEGAVLVDEAAGENIAEIDQSDFIMLSDESSLLSESDTIDMSSLNWDVDMASDVIVIA
jgi:hypothetical protein